MWISKKEYEKLKQERNDALYESEMNKSLYNGLRRDIINLQSKYNKLKEATLKLFEVEIYLHGLKPIVYDIKASTSEEAEQCAIKLFTDNNKDFSTSDIIMITTNMKYEKLREVGV